MKTQLIPQGHAPDQQRTVKPDYKRGSRYCGLTGTVIEESLHTATLRFAARNPVVCFHRDDLQTQTNPNPSQL